MSQKKKQPVIGTIFSSDSSDGEFSYASSSATERKKTPVRLKVNMKSEKEDVSVKPRSFDNPPPIVNVDPAPEGFMEIEKTKIGTIRHNTLIQYEKNDGKIIKSKYFKKMDAVGGNIVVGFYTHGKRNYSELLSNIKKIYINAGGAKGESEQLKDTIEIHQDQWKTLRRDMVISYEKENREYVYKAKFNSFLSGPDGSTRMSLTSERGYNFVANPNKILKIFRHLTGNDKTLTFILEAIRKLEMRVRQLESKFNK